jgi:sensor domain CHASE-containing protein
MKLKGKVSIVVLIVVILYAAADWGVQEMIVLPGFLQLEQQEAQENMHQASAALAKEAEVLSSQCHDWAAWDDTYRFIIDRNQNYQKANLVAESYTGLKLNLILFYDEDGNYVAGQGYDLGAKQFVDFKKMLPPKLGRDHLLRARTQTTDSSVAGLMATGMGPMMIAAQPIITSQNKGPVRGMVVMGWLLDAARRSRLKEQLMIDLDFLPVTARVLAPAEQRIIEEMAQSQTDYFGRARDENRMFGYTLIPGIDGKPFLLLRATLPRDIYQQGRKTIRNSLMSTLLIGLFVILVLTWTTQRRIVQPIMKLVAHIADTKITDELTPMRLEDYQDELGILAEEYNSLIERLERKKRLNQKYQQDREELIGELKAALSKVKQLSGFLPICASCKKIRDDKGYWNQIESYIRDHSEAKFSHGLCPECCQKLYPGYDLGSGPDSKKTA